MALASSHGCYFCLSIRSSFDFVSIQLSKVLLERSRKFVTRTFSSDGTDSLGKCAETQISYAGKVNSKKALINTVKNMK